MRPETCLIAVFTNIPGMVTEENAHANKIKSSRGNFICIVDMVEFLKLSQKFLMDFFSKISLRLKAISNFAKNVIIDTSLR